VGRVLRLRRCGRPLVLLGLAIAGGCLGSRGLAFEGSGVLGGWRLGPWLTGIVGCLGGEQDAGCRVLGSRGLPSFEESYGEWRGLMWPASLLLGRDCP
jgi:hypothetical protein